MMPGTPNNSTSRQRTPLRNSSIFQMSPNQWMIPTRSRACGSG
jgi:hypothetical protein